MWSLLLMWSLLNIVSRLVESAEDDGVEDAVDTLLYINLEPLTLSLSL
jgi:hypothetical protein